ncbi:MAG TPA: HEAT repeat domain-containing protein [Nocardioides sp.]|nr:HEAT repeat domain-containing protein [Nocardioides sp.]
MQGVAEYRETLQALDPAAWPDYLDEHSGLPGPRGNVELALAAAELASPELDDALIASGDEYRTFCGVVGLGTRAADPTIRERLRQHASDDRWRVREAVAMALQRLGDVDLPQLEEIVLDWADDPDPFVQRAAAAAICEPRLVATRHTAAVAVEVCRRATTALAARPVEERQDADVRSLRQGLGHCWSVAVAADPEPGLAAFHALDTHDPDVAWIVRENRTKKRLADLL